jgi:hypothetical protein
MNPRGAVPLAPGQTATGVVPAVDVDMNTMTASRPKLVPWHKSALIGDSRKDWKRNAEVWSSEQVPQQMVDQMHAGLPPMIRRTANERYESLVRRLTETARVSKQAYGRVVWPLSVQKVLTEIGVKPTADERTQVYALAKHYIVKSENQQRAKDARKVAVDWHGHFD